MRGPALKIEVLEIATFHATLDQDYILRQDRFFQGHFNSPQNIFNHLN